MLHCLLLVELADIALGDDLYRVILSCRPVEICLNVLPMIERHDEYDLQTPL
jgi:hypothetical protein